MAKGNWNPEVIKPKTRCRYCGHVIKGTVYRVEGCMPCHPGCAQARGLEFSTEIERVFDPNTMTLANGQDVFRMWKLLWGDASPQLICHLMKRLEDLFDLTQLPTEYDFQQAFDTPEIH